MAMLRIMSGGAPKEIFLQLTPQFERKSGHKVEFLFAVMSTLRAPHEYAATRASSAMVSRGY